VSHGRTDLARRTGPFTSLRSPRRSVVVGALVALGIGSMTGPVRAADIESVPFPLPIQTLDGSGNNVARPSQGRIGQPYSRVAPAAYTDGRTGMVPGPNARFISNRLINDINQNVFSENGVTQWLWTWGQFLDHTFGLAEGGGAADVRNIPFDAGDPLEQFTNTLGAIPFTRDAVVPGTGVTGPREQINTVSSYIDGYAIYGGSNARLDYLRDGSLDGDPTNNAATMMLPGGFLPTTAARGGAALPGPAMAVDGRLRGAPNQAMLAGDVRANENIALTATHTLFAREHNRIVSLLPDTLTAEEKFQIARRVVIAEQQFITYNEFLPTAGVRLPAYTGYKPNVDPTLSQEFAVAGYRAHSMIHGELEVETEVGHYPDAQLAQFRASGIKVEIDGEELVLAIPLNVAFFNPTLLRQIGIDETLKVLSGEPQYKNDNMIDNQLRSVMFQVPRPGSTSCIEPVDRACFQGVVDLGAIDIERGRDHGLPTYNQLRRAYGLAPKTSFGAITGESDSFPSDPMLLPGHELFEPEVLDFMSLRDRSGASIPLGSPAASTDAVDATQRTTTAARLKAIYNNDINSVDAFSGLIAERHLPRSEFGELQNAIWARQFQALRDGDRFFYGANDTLDQIRNTYGIDFRRTLAQVIAANTGIPVGDLQANVFVSAG
jgi:hypothetical protein